MRYDILDVKDLKLSTIERMLQLMKEHYDNVLPEKFIRDLKEKDKVILIMHGEELIGFTTLMYIRDTVNDEEITVLYSGDTVIDMRFWGQMELFKGFGKVLREGIRIYENLYWLLLSKGIRTYLMLPLFFKKFYPNYKGDYPMDYESIALHFAKKKFGSWFDEKSGLVKPNPPADRLKPELARIPDNLLKNPHVRYFLERNPYYVMGVELVCITRISEDNLTRAGLKFVFGDAETDI